MQAFKINPQEFKSIKRKLLLRFIPFYFIVAGIGAAIGIANDKKNSLDMGSIVIVIAIMCVVMTFSIFNVIKKQKKILDSYVLIIENGILTRKLFNTPTININQSDISKIVKHPNGDIVITGKSREDLIGVPFQIEKKQELEEILKQWHVIILLNKTPLLQKYPMVFGLFVAGFMLCFFTINNVLVTAIIGTILIILLVWSFIKIRKSKNIDNRTKNSSWLMLIVLISIVIIMIGRCTHLFENMLKR